MNIVELLNKGFVEFIRTFSNKSSFLSSKRIERFFVFTTMLIISCYYLVKSIYYNQIVAVDLMIVVGGWLTYNGFGIIQGKKDKKTNQDTDGN